MNAPLIPEMNALREWEELSGRERQVLQRALSIGNQQLKLFYLKIREPLRLVPFGPRFGVPPKKDTNGHPLACQSGESLRCEIRSL